MKHEPKKTTYFKSAILMVCLTASFSEALSRSANSLDQKQTEAAFEQLQLAANAIGQGQLEKAESLLSAILVSAPRDADALNLFGVVRAQQHRNRDAESFFRRTLLVAPKHIGAHLNLAELYLSDGRKDEALKVLQAAYHLAPERDDVNLHLATLYSSLSKFDLAWQHLNAIQQPSNDGNYYTLKLTVLLGLKRLPEASTVASKILNAGLDADTQAQCALLLDHSGLKDEAKLLLDAASANSPKSFGVLYASGVIEGENKDFKNAENDLNAALNLRSGDVGTLRALARVARAQGELEKSLSYLVRARKLDPDSPGVLYDFGAIALQMDLYLDALNAFSELHKRFPAEPSYSYALAAARLRNGERLEAVRLLKEFVVIRPNDASGFYLLGAALYALKDFAEAQKALEKSLNLLPDADAEYLLGLSLAEKGDRKGSIEALLRAVSDRSDHVGAHAALGAEYREDGKYDQARLHLERAIALNPKDLRAHYQLGLVYAKLGDQESARKMFARADELRSEERKQDTLVLKLIDAPQ